MVGHGKGKSSISLSIEQLGFSKGEMLPTVLQPSSSYPMLDHKPLPIQITTEMSYLVELKRDFTEYMRESSNNVQAVIFNEDIERYCEDYEETIIGYNRSEYELKYDWTRMPIELKSSRKHKNQRQKAIKPNKKKIIESIIEKKLIELEKKENTQQLDTEEEVEEEEEGENENEEKEIGERVKDEEEIDEEMDNGTDYANDYFDTGENYCSEDDNDDGPVFEFNAFSILELFVLQI